MNSLSLYGRAAVAIFARMPPKYFELSSSSSCGSEFDRYATAFLQRLVLSRLHLVLPLAVSGRVLSRQACAGVICRPSWTSSRASETSSHRVKPPVN
jgi:hypothetical protein